MRQIQSRIEKLAAILCTVKPSPTPEQAVSQMALRHMSGEDLMVLRSIIKAGRPLIASTERESQAIGAYRSAVEKAIALTNDNLKRGKSHRLTDHSSKRCSIRAGILR